MILLRIRHRTHYRYQIPVLLGVHRLMLRPRESREVQLIEHDVQITPAAALDWSYDVGGNAVAQASFTHITESLTIESVSRLYLSSPEWPLFNIAVSAMNYPFRYSDDDWADLGNLVHQQYADPGQRLHSWARAFVTGATVDTLTLLRQLSEGIAGQTLYELREDEGTQTPVTTLDRKMGSCRDFALLFVEAARSLGFGARIVSGYLYQRTASTLGFSGTGSTHAWAEVFLPGAGWITFDPTNRSMGGFNLIPVAVARDLRLAMPVSGSYIGPSDALAEMSVQVELSAESGA